MFFIEAASIPTDGERVEYLLAFTLGSKLALVDTHTHTKLPHTNLKLFLRKNNYFKAIKEKKETYNLSFSPKASKTIPHCKGGGDDYKNMYPLIDY